jgi:hypothetical protein
MAERRGSTVSWAGCRVSCRWQAVSEQLYGDSRASRGLRTIGKNLYE